MKPVYARKKRGSIRPAGYIFLLILFLNLFAALNTGLNLLYIILGGVVSFTVLSWLLALLTLRRLNMTREAPDAVHRGDAFLTGIRIENRKRFLPAISVRLESAAAPGETAGYVLKISGRHTAQLTISERYHKRGVHMLPPLDLVTTFPFGLTERRVRLDDHKEVVVYPRITPVRTAAVEELPGATAAPRGGSGDGDEFHALREYQPGDEMRHIAWRISARRGKWMVREFTMQQSRNIVIVLDTRTEPGAGTALFEEAIEFTASLAISLLQRLYHVAVMTPGASISGGTGTGQQRKVLELMARVTPVPPEAHEDFDEKVCQAHTPGIRLVSISPDPREWNTHYGPGGAINLNPGEILHV
jgi:uncharacterized protein (DUF58 family)